MSLVLSVFEQGLIYAIMALGLYITYKILDFPDMTVDGSFPLGAAITAMLITKGWNPFLTLPISFAAGAVAGMLTGLIHVKYQLYILCLYLCQKHLWPVILYGSVIHFHMP